MNNQTLREKLKAAKKYPNAMFLKNAPVIHKGFPSCFNLSFAEYEMIENSEGYIKYNHDFIFSKIQPCIRHQDWKTIISDSEDNYRYLSVFDMADVSGCIVKQGSDHNNEAVKFAIKSFINFIKDIGLNVEKLRVSYFKGGSVIDATKGKYTFEKIIGEDPLVEYWLELGLQRSQLIPNSTRDTLLALNIFGLPTPWGFRNEIHYIHNDKEIDIGTVESLVYEPLIKNGSIVDLEQFQNTVAISAIGIERLLLILNKKENIWEIETIEPLIDKVMEMSVSKEAHRAMVLIQALRAIHRIVADGGLYTQLNKHRKTIIRFFYKELFENATILSINLSDSSLQNLLQLNAKLQPYYPELSVAIKITIKEIGLRKQAFETDRSLKNTGV